ncbi:MAG TPA: NAD(P)-dependent oxidoreductase [Geminicoccaceae bacterium]|nr:NAD(P)-dependent oxidoreductase [Geminicoccus sp.]HMU49648.1 NAD(P)-dependent oxidoreductase [Geminicoccaceae bacterium]
MRVLLTGVGSFTGCWFATALAEAGADVVGTCRASLDSYDGLSRRRLDTVLAAGCRLVEGTAFGDAAFVAAIASHGPFDLLCHHGAEVGDLRRPGYDPVAALASNTLNADTVMRRLAAAGGRGLVVTGSVFEADEGGGEGPPVNAYGLAKTLTWHMLRFHAAGAGLAVGRFVVPHPFGPLEKPGFTSGLVRSWLAGREGIVRRPELVRDFVPVDLLARAFADFCRRLLGHGGSARAAPTGHVGGLGELALMFSYELGSRLGRRCAVAIRPDPALSGEPPRRINSGRSVLSDPSDVARSWDRYAAHHISGDSSSIYG